MIVATQKVLYSQVRNSSVGPSRAPDTRDTVESGNVKGHARLSKGVVQHGEDKINLPCSIINPADGALQFGIVRVGLLHLVQLRTKVADKSVKVLNGKQMRVSKLTLKRCIGNCFSALTAGADESALTHRVACSSDSVSPFWLFGASGVGTRARRQDE